MVSITSSQPPLSLLGSVERRTTRVFRETLTEPAPFFCRQECRKQKSTNQPAGPVPPPVTICILSRTARNRINSGAAAAGSEGLRRRAGAEALGVARRQKGLPPPAPPPAAGRLALGTARCGMARLAGNALTPTPCRTNCPHPPPLPPRLTPPPLAAGGLRVRVCVCAARRSPTPWARATAEWRRAGKLGRNGPGRLPGAENPCGSVCVCVCVCVCARARVRACVCV